jgi:hypothetical protein
MLIRCLIWISLITIRTMGQNSYSMAYRQCVIASGAKQSLPENRDCFVA